MPEKPVQPSNTDGAEESILSGLSFEQIKLEPWYKDIEDEVTQPDQVTVQSKYFWKRWARILGPVPSMLLLRLRQYCYYNRETGEKRDWCFPSQETLAHELGLDNRKTIMEALRRLEVLGFIRRERQYRLDPGTRKPRRTTDKYFIRMWDPIAPEDEGQALVLAAQHAIREAPKPVEKQPAPYKSEKRTYRDQSV